MKAKLITILSQCIYNKSIDDFNVIMELINTVNDDKTEGIELSYSNVGLYVSMLNNGKLCSIMFTDNDEIMLSLPDDISKTYVIENCGYNISYSDLSNILNSDN